MTTDSELFADIPDPAAAARAPKPAEASAPAEPSPTRGQMASRRWLAIAVGTGWGIAVALYFGLRPDISSPGVLLQLGVWTIALPVGLSLAVRPGRRGFPAGVVALRLGLSALPAAFAVLALLPMEGAQAVFSFKTVRWCLSVATVAGLPSLIGAAIVLRSALLSAPASRGALVGAVCGLAGATSIHSHCPVVTVSHVLVAHGLPILALAAAGAIIGRVWGRV